MLCAAPSRILPATQSSGALWLGGSDVLSTARFFAENKITHVLSVCNTGPARNIPLQGREYVCIKDFPGENLLHHLSRAVRFVAEARHGMGASVYVHCHAGISRSASVVIAYLMCHLSLTFSDAWTALHGCRTAIRPNAGFEKQLMEFETSPLRRQLIEEMHVAHPNHAELVNVDSLALQTPNAARLGCLSDASQQSPPKHPAPDSQERAGSLRRKPSPLRRALRSGRHRQTDGGQSSLTCLTPGSPQVHCKASGDTSMKQRRRCRVVPGPCA
eukprot:TRINITY_DN62430_c0_g1_i1.p1 TRINITY_DN62430_c0_g1~~TRINITY_DN62430_c0_g1_i1.p1  ORF type:complete len:273 (+),score=25.53 TRINITY_DN62430_c0_g1_i1:68-886(+)